MSKIHKTLFISFSIACIVAIITCVIVNLAIDRSITWSAYPILSVSFGWLILTPLLAKKFGIVLSICSLMVFILPFLYLLAKITPVRNWFVPLGIPSAIVGMIFLWLIYLMFRFLKISLWYKFAITVFLGGVVVSPVIDNYVNIFLNIKPQLFNLILNISTSVIVTVVLCILGYRRSKLNYF